MRTIFCAVFLLGSIATTVLSAEDKIPPPNYDESKVPEYVLPDPLTMQDGRKVETAEQWNKERRPEILDLFCEHVYGRPVLKTGGAGPIRAKSEILSSAPAFDGKGVRHLIKVVFYTGESPKEDSPVVNFLVYTPPVKEKNAKFPVFLGLHFGPIHTISRDPGIPLTTTWQRKKNQILPSEESDRGSAERRFPVETILERGYALAVAYYYEIEPDFKAGIHKGVRGLIYKDGASPKPNEPNAIGTWAWGLGMLLDVLIAQETALQIDPEKVVVWGHSRLGKTSLWAGAIDPRFAIVVTNNSGCGGAALSRREFGETVRKINSWNLSWFCENFKKYSRDVNALPVDQHELVALIAPRPVYVASASKDLWADPKGEFLAALHADPVYRLLGTDGFGGVKDMPGINQPVGARIAYHLREGEHDMLEYDWIQYMNFADKYFAE